MHHDIRQRLTTLLHQAGSAHGEYETRELGGVYDQNWPDWYAAYLVEHGLSDLLGQAMTVGQVSRLLKACDEAYRSERLGVGWPEYYSVQIIRHFQAA